MKIRMGFVSSSSSSSFLAYFKKSDLNTIVFSGKYFDFDEDKELYGSARLSEFVTRTDFSRFFNIDLDDDLDELDDNLKEKLEKHHKYIKQGYILYECTVGSEDGHPIGSHCYINGDEIDLPEHHMVIDFY